MPDMGWTNHMRSEEEAAHYSYVQEQLPRAYEQGRLQAVHGFGYPLYEEWEEYPELVDEYDRGWRSGYMSIERNLPG